MNNTPWGLKDVLASVILRLVIYGMNQIDIEMVLKRLDGVKLLNSKVLEENWWRNWDELGRNYMQRAEQAEKEGHAMTARSMYFYASACYYAASLINYMDFSQKVRTIELYTSAFKDFTRLAVPAIQRCEIPLDAETDIPGYLYLPSCSGPYPCIILLTGIGASKEEAHAFAAPLVERGVAVFTPDVPGTGEALFFRGQKFRWDDIRRALKASTDFLSLHPDLDKKRLGIYGVCMSGPLGLKYTAFDERIKLCSALFPLQIEVVDKTRVPRWMQEGPWYNYYSGNAPSEEFIRELSVEPEEYINCPLFFIHSKDDNWMPLAAVEKLAERSRNEKRVFLVNEKSVFNSDMQVVHTIPVGEQIHWVKHIMADWISDKFAEIKT